MSTQIQQEYDALTPEQRAWVDGLIRLLRQSQVAPVAPDEAPAFTGLKGYGSMRGQIKLAPDFDEPLDDFKDYM